MKTDADNATAPTFDVEESLGYWICSASHALRRALESELSAEGITLRQWEVLAWLVIDGEQSQCHLAERMGIEAPTLAGVVSRMERDGWLERANCPDDRRKKLLKMTALATGIWTRTVDCSRRVRAAAIAEIAPEDLLTFRRVCEQIRVNLTPYPQTQTTVPQVESSKPTADSPAVQLQAAASDESARLDHNDGS